MMIAAGHNDLDVLNALIAAGAKVNELSAVSCLSECGAMLLC